MSFTNAKAEEINCNRTSSDTTGFTNYSAMEDWFPKTITLDISIFSAKPNSTAVIAKQGITNLTLLKNGKLTAQIENTSGYRQTAPARYKCDMGASDVKLALNNTSPGNSISEEGSKVSRQLNQNSIFG